ncbi:MAG: rhodanese-like domain-containing protein [Verrucomicrobia bacterium]|nr:rhodanese-like domain-containing protein [Verrucomicrobiota bacterium]
MNRNLVVILVVVAVFLLLRLATRRDSRSAVAEALESGARIIDVRTPGEFTQDHYVGAINIPLAELRERLDELGPKDGAIVLYCATGPRASLAKRMLKRAGYEKTLNAGGLRNMP